MSAVVDFPVKPEARPYLDAALGHAGEPDWLARHRRRSLARFAEQGFPSRRGEAWRYLDLRPLEQSPLLPIRAIGAISPSAARRHQLRRRRSSPGAGRWAVYPRTFRDRGAARGRLARLDGGGELTRGRSWFARRWRHPRPTATAVSPRSTAPFSATALSSMSRPASFSTGRSKSSISPQARFRVRCTPAASSRSARKAASA